MAQSLAAYKTKTHYDMGRDPKNPADMWLITVFLSYKGQLTELATFKSRNAALAYKHWRKETDVYFLRNKWPNEDRPPTTRVGAKIIY